MLFDLIDEPGETLHLAVGAGRGDVLATHRRRLADRLERLGDPFAMPVWGG